MNENKTRYKFIKLFISFKSMGVGIREASQAPPPPLKPEFLNKSKLKRMKEYFKYYYR
jgi:hypothetical protein